MPLGKADAVGCLGSVGKFILLIIGLPILALIIALIFF